MLDKWIKEDVVHLRTLLDSAQRSPSHECLLRREVCWVRKTLRCILRGLVGDNLTDIVSTKHMKELVYSV
jgi:hypothetical protein